jgi:hypothetical protein
MHFKRNRTGLVSGCGYGDKGEGNAAGLTSE